MTMLVERYNPATAAAWDAFVAGSKNGTFLFRRGYMDYHADRFADHSLLIRDDGGTLRALLPGHADGSNYGSHGGLTYGGFVTGPDMKVPAMLEVFEATAAYLAEQGFGSWKYKTIPMIYHIHPAEEDRYALFLANATLGRRDVLAVVDRRAALPYQERRARSVNKARKEGLTFAEEPGFAEYWNVVAANLVEKYGVAPVHSLAEIESLRARFPENIRLVACRDGARLLGGVVLYTSATVAHVQYIASTDEGRKRGALDGLFDHLLTHPGGERYFDFGISNEQGGRKLNRGLIDQKEGFGARAVVHDHYRIDLTTWRAGQILEALA